jgi:adenylate kinase family enzyme
MRIAVVGTSGSGKSTLARKLGAALSLPVVELDAINWQAGWKDLNVHDPDEFARRVEAAIAGEAWVTDGNYSKVLPAILRRATDVVWLDLPKTVVMRRVIGRSLARAWSGEELWPGTGNRESWRRWLDKDHPIRWAWDTYEGRRARYEAAFADAKLAHLTVHRPRTPAQAAAVIGGLQRAAQR